MKGLFVRTFLRMDSTKSLFSYSASLIFIILLFLPVYLHVSVTILFPLNYILLVISFIMVINALLRGPARLLLIKFAMLFCWGVAFHCMFISSKSSLILHQYFAMAALLALYLQSALKTDLKLLLFQQQFIDKRNHQKHAKSLFHSENISLLVAIAVLSYVGYFLLNLDQSPNHQTITRLLAIMLIVSPSSIYYAFKLPQLSAAKQLAESNIKISSLKALYRLHKIDTIVFATTRVFCKKQPVIEQQVIYSDATEKDIFSLALSLESHSMHSLATAFMDKAKQLNCEAKAVSMYQNIEGFGIRAKCDGKWLLLGNLRFMQKSHIDISNVCETLPQTTKIEHSRIFMAYDNQLTAVFLVTYQLRHQINDILSSLMTHQLKLKLLTGRNKIKAKHISNQINIDQVEPELLPHQKQKSLNSMIQGGHKLALITSDLDLVTYSSNKPNHKISLSNLAELPHIFSIIRQMATKQAKLFIFALSYNICALFLTKSFFFHPQSGLSPLLIAIGLSSSATLSVVLASILGWQNNRQNKTLVPSNA